MAGYPNKSLGLELLQLAIKFVIIAVLVISIGALTFRCVKLHRENNALIDRITILEAQSQWQRVVKFDSLFDIRVGFPDFVPYPVPVPMPIIIKNVDGIPPLDPYPDPVNPAPKPDPNCRTY